MTNTIAGRKVVSYESYFSKVLHKRLKYLNKINALIAVFISITLSIPYGNFWWNFLWTFLFRGPIIFIALFLIKISRDLFTTVEYSPYKTLGSQIYHVIFSKVLLCDSAFYITSSLFISFIYILQLSFRADYYLIAKEYQQKPIINDEWVYYWFYSVYLGLVYASQHLIFQRNRLNFTYGVSKVKPEDGLRKNLPGIFGKSLFLNIVTSITSPIIYYFVRSAIYKINILPIMILGLDTEVPSFKVSFSTYFITIYFSFQVLVCWEIVNHVYDVYSKIGCLDGNKPISTYSSDPINTLLSGLRDTENANQLSRLTAFQELAYIATTNEEQGVKLRVSIFNAHSKGGFIWPAILDECAMVIKETASKINYRSSADLKALNEQQDKIKDKYMNLLSLDGEDNEIFGNSSTRTPKKSNQSVSKLEKYDFKKISTTTEKSPFKSVYQFVDIQVINPLNSILTSFSSNNKTNHSIVSMIYSNVNTIVRGFKVYHNRFLSTNFGIFFRTSLKRDTESRVTNPVNFGNSVIAISNLLIKSIKEDKQNSISGNHIAEVLNLLEKPIRVSSHYTDYLPASVFLSASQRENEKLVKNHLIALLHDLTMNEFFHICINFNYKLNDLILNPRTFKLAKWVIDQTIAQQQSKHNKKR